MEADGRLLGLVLTYVSEHIADRERGTEERERTVLVVKYNCDEQQGPSVETWMHVGKTLLSKDMMEVQRLIARTSKQEKTQSAC